MPNSFGIGNQDIQHPFDLQVRKNTHPQECAFMFSKPKTKDFLTCPF